MTIYLVRHGRAAAGVEDLDPGLDESGQEQALYVGQALAGRPVGRLVVSPMRRTRETIAPLAAALGIEPEVREEVSEVFDPAMASDARRTMIGPFMQGFWSDQPAELQNWRRRCLDAVLDLSLATSSRIATSLSSPITSPSAPSSAMPPTTTASCRHYRQRLGLELRARAWFAAAPRRRRHRAPPGGTGLRHDHGDSRHPPLTRGIINT
jgi:hypothetical protein